jgi:predicted transcriptional regulator
MDVPQVAEALGMSKGAVRKAIARGTIKAIVVVGGPRGGGTLYGYYVVEPQEVERYKKENRRKTKKPEAK